MKSIYLKAFEYASSAIGSVFILILISSLFTDFFVKPFIENRQITSLILLIIFIGVLLRYYFKIKKKKIIMN